MNPIATLYMANKTHIIIELLPESAPNTVSSFIYAAGHGVFNRHPIERIVPGHWIDMSYTGFRKKEGQYLIPYESELHPEITPLDSDIGCVCMGGYGELGESGCEFFFPLRSCPEHKGIYPVFGKVISGIEEILRLEHIRTRPVEDFPIPGVEANTPVIPEIIDHVELDLKGVSYPEPVQISKSVTDKIRSHSHCKYRKTRESGDPELIKIRYSIRNHHTPLRCRRRVSQTQET